MRRLDPRLQALGLALLLYAFFLGLDLIGLSFKLLGRGFSEALFERTSDPFVGLLIGLLATTLVQSSSTTTSLTVALVAAGALDLRTAIPIVMGANIGTSVTNTLVAMAHVSRREEFQRAFAGATVHDFFNGLAVLLLFPLELATGYLAGTAARLEGLLEGVGGIRLFDPLKAVVRPVAERISGLLEGSGYAVLAVGALLLVASLKLLVDLLKIAMSGRAERLLHRSLFRSTAAAVLGGVVVTVMVQSSSVTTSLMVPLVGAGVVTLEQMFPYTVGANIGTTVTALLAALSTGSPAAVSVALAHLVFNLSASLLIYLPPPVRAIPLNLARRLGALSARRRILAAVYIVVVFYGLPLLLLFAFGKL